MKLSLDIMLCDFLEDQEAEKLDKEKAKVLIRPIKRALVAAGVREKKMKIIPWENLSIEDLELLGDAASEAAHYKIFSVPLV